MGSSYLYFYLNKINLYIFHIYSEPIESCGVFTSIYWLIHCNKYTDISEIYDLPRLKKKEKIKLFTKQIVYINLTHLKSLVKILKS